jgi:hypothetical protein
VWYIPDREEKSGKDRLGKIEKLRSSGLASVGKTDGGRHPE